MITKTDTLLSKALLDKKLVSPDLLQAVAEEAAQSKESLAAILFKKQAIPEDEILKNLAEVLKLSVVSLDNFKPDPAVLEKVPLKVADYYKIIPLKIEKRKLTVAVSSPLDLRTQDDIRAHLGYEVVVVLAKEREVTEALKRYYGFGAGMINEMMAQSSAAPKPAVSSEGASDYSPDKLEDIEKMAGDASVAKLVNQIILEAYKKRATDIHIEPYRGKVKIRYRIDGELYDAHAQAEMAKFVLPILSRIKIMANLNIVERRLPQDGRAVVKVENAQLDLRVSCIPTPYGESVVIRMLPMNRIINLADLGLSDDQAKIFEQLIQKPHGIIFATGPTGSGKSTTLYACLNKINTEDRKIITIEDPVEYEMEGVTQIQVASNIGLDFAKGLRSILRHDPDVIMVGEVRDLETAEIAIRVALTGHLVLSTLHTNDAASGITRLVDIGIQPYLVASSVEVFIAQRLVRRVCTQCKEEDKSQIAEAFKKQIAADLNRPLQKLTIFRGKGCDHCNGSGFWGRVAIYEILLMSERIRDHVMKRVPASGIKKAAIVEGMRTLKQDGWEKVLKGLTTPEEILEVAEEEKEAMGGEDLEAADGEGEDSGFLREFSQFKPRDRRLFVRLEHSINVRYRIVKTPPTIEDLMHRPATAMQFTSAKNISAGGLVFITKEEVSVESILDLVVELPDEQEPIHCLAKVIRQEPVENGKKFDTAVCFMDLSPASRSRLERYIEKEKS